MPHESQQPVPDTEIAQQVRRAKAGSQEAFAFLYGRFLPLVHAILLGRFPPVLADDLTQECFIAAFRGLDQLQDGSKFGAWIAVIARRTRPASMPTRSVDVSVDDFTIDGAKPEDVAEAARMMHAISNLPEAYRETLILRLVEGMSGDEISSLTGLTPKSVRVNLHRGMAKLRVALGLQPRLPVGEVNDGC